jgi:putative hydrolase of the HAD superfamily
MKISTPKNIDFNSISTLIFDWGNVIIPIYPEKTLEAFRTLGHSDFDKYFAHEQEDTIFHHFEKGLVEREAVYGQMCAEIGRSLSPSAIDEALCCMMGTTPEIRLTLLKKLRPHFHLFLLSNTNSIHTNYCNRQMMDKQGVDFVNLFHKVYYSYTMGLRKPGREIFQKVIDENQLDVKQTLFLDDLQTNIDTALSLGMQALQITPEQPIEKIFRAWL